MTLPSVVEADHDERGVADLLWFPTGGGKTEAYLGLFALATFHRRISRDGAAGVTSIMRYTLRLLTTQQFERASRLVCACERIRRSEDDLGDEPISIGLFVGRDSTPNTLDDAKAALTKLGANNPVNSGNPCQLKACPWCQSVLEPSNYVIRENPRRLHIECRTPDCEFRAGLPVHVVDEDLFRARPTLVIGTVDKFASMPWRPDLGNLFNVNSADPPPDLIIQDELHLISGPLGTLTGLYETAVDLICEHGGHTPKVIASTATIRRARAQAQGLFARKMRQFPPPGLDPGDSWFATRAPADEVGTRRYVGLMAPGTSHATLLIRTFAALLDKAFTSPPGPSTDPYWSVVGYFNSLRVLGAARMQVQDDVHDRLAFLTGGTREARKLGEPIELTSRASSSDIPDYLARMEQMMGQEGAVDVILATNMISVGVDVDRLGLMVMMGQPQAAAEYIQATSRVGRRHPGLVAVLLNAARSRDRSHYEGFKGFHQTLYRSVEATSVTPFSPRARDRALHAVLVALARQRIPELRDSPGAAKNERAALEVLRDEILGRVETVESAEADETAEHLDRIIQRWVTMAANDDDLVYESRDGKRPALLTAASPENEETTSMSTMWSLRDVDAESNLFFKSLR